MAVVAVDFVPPGGLAALAGLLGDDVELAVAGRVLSHLGDAVLH